MALTSCYAPMEYAGGGDFKDSTAVVYQYNEDGTVTGKKEFEYKSIRKLTVKETVFVPINPMALWAASFAGEDTESDSSGVSPETETPTPIDTNSALPNDTNAIPEVAEGPDTLVEMEITDKRFYIDDYIYKQKRLVTSYHGGSTIVKEQSKQKSKTREGCVILICRKSKIYNEFEELVFKENFNPFYHRSVRYVYDEGGKKLEKRKVKFYFKPKFRNYP